MSKNVREDVAFPLEYRFTFTLAHVHGRYYPLDNMMATEEIYNN